MKFVNYLEKISGVTIYQIFSFLLFSAIFLYVLYWVFKADKKQLDEINHLPLDN